MKFLILKKGQILINIAPSVLKMAWGVDLNVKFFVEMKKRSNPLPLLSIVIPSAFIFS